MGESVKEIIAQNLIELRKKNRLTQGQLAEKLNYSDKAVSRWEHSETLPDIETLCKICDIYGVKFEYLLQKEQPKKNNPYVIKNDVTSKILIMFIALCTVWIGATLVYIYGDIIFDARLWTAFIWAIPLSAIVCYICNYSFWKNRAFGCVILSIFTWSFILAIYLQLLKYNAWMLFILGIPLQAMVILVTVFKSKNPEFSITKRRYE